VSCQQSLNFTEEELPDFDSSTATGPLMHHVIAELTDLPLDTVVNYYEHSQTFFAFARLVSEEVDLIFSMEPTADLLEQLEEVRRQINEEADSIVLETIDLKWEPIAKEAFVFIANKANPVNNLSIQQIKDIYTGKTNNWKALGGLDTLIAPFQRNPDSGSQQIMENLVMNGLDMIEAKADHSPGGMSLMTHVIAYDNNINAIGYNIRYHVLNMDPDPNVKLLSINGVAPTVENIQNGTYPFSGEICVIYRANEPRNSKVRKIVRWLSSKEGKAAIEAGNNVPLD
ncbi:MAG: substrate-binding domain-containing protein, partial [Bacteroidota bacterium]